MAPWADEPFSLIPVKTIDTKTEDGRFIASEMALAHNGMLRTLNAIYNQAPYVKKEADIADLVQYAIFWVEWLEEHHQAEEEKFFPDIGRVIGDTSIMAKNVEQHHAFTPGLEKFHTYLKGVREQKNKEKTYDGKVLQKHIDSFAPMLRNHLGEEIETLAGLEKFDIAAVRQEYNKFDAYLRTVSPTETLHPLVLRSADATFEGLGPWPPVPGFAYYLIHYYYERKYKSVWRMCPSDTWGKKRQLAFGP